jgi:hypothetical protein
MNFNTDIKNRIDLNNLIDNIINNNKSLLTTLFTNLPIYIYFDVNDYIDDINKELIKLKLSIRPDIIKNIKNTINIIIDSIKDYTHNTNIKKINNTFESYYIYLDVIDNFKIIKKEKESEDEENYLISQEEEEEEGLHPTRVGVINTFTTKNNLKELSSKEVFGEDKLMDKETILKYKKDLIKNLEKVDKINILQQTILKRKIIICGVLEEYYDFLFKLTTEHDVNNVFKLNGDIPHDDLKFLRYKVKASNSENIKYTHDNGIIYFWVLKDAIVFMTI